MRHAIVAGIYALLLLSSACTPLAPRYEVALTTLEREAREDAALLDELRDECQACGDAITYGARSLRANARLACAIRYDAAQRGAGMSGALAGVLGWFGFGEPERPVSLETSEDCRG